jgi:hypothetical protein
MTRANTGSVEEVHPIERLRYVARGGWAGSTMLAAEAGWALADLAEREVPALVPACRRLLDRQPGCGSLWWLAAHVLCAADPVFEAQRCAQDLEDDPTPSLVFDALPSGARAVRHGGVGEVASADIVVVEVEALGEGGMVVDSTSVSLLEAARAALVPVWVEAGVGRILPPRLWEAMSRRLVEGHSQTGGGNRGVVHAHNLRLPPARHHGTLVDNFGVEKVVGPSGANPVDVALSNSSCPEPAELLEDF